jgi:hypothetical protein
MVKEIPLASALFKHTPDIQVIRKKQNQDESYEKPDSPPDSHASWIHLETDCRSCALAIYYDQQEGQGIGEERLISQDLTPFAATGEIMRSACKALFLFTCLSAPCILVFSGCSTIRVNTYAAGMKPPLCQSDIANQKILVLWGTAWRSDQKEADRREQIASVAIPRFFNSTSCYGSATVQKSIDGRDGISMSDSQILKSDIVVSGKFQKIVVLRLEELGPTLMFYLSPILWQGSTKVSLRIRVLDVATSSLDSDVAMHWEKGGAFVIRGVKSLEDSLTAALASVFQRGKG